MNIFTKTSDVNDYFYESYRGLHRTHIDAELFCMIYFSRYVKTLVPIKFPDINIVAFDIDYESSGRPLEKGVIVAPVPAWFKGVK